MTTRAEFHFSWVYTSASQPVGRDPLVFQVGREAFLNVTVFY